MPVKNQSIPPCPDCGSRRSTCKKSLPTDCGNVYRKRLCHDCGTIYETIQSREVNITDFREVHEHTNYLKKRTVSINPPFPNLHAPQTQAHPPLP